MKKINEIFYSLQGEGFHVGTPAVFVRFSGCNLKCEFCDTRHEEGVMMSDEEILEQVCQYPCKTVILTGGEPGLWVDEDLVAALHKAGKYVCIETNGTCVLPESIDWVTCSPKLGASLRVCRMDEVKVVFRAGCIPLSSIKGFFLFFAALFLSEYGRGRRIYQVSSPVATESADP